MLQERLLTGSPSVPRQIIDFLNVNYHVAKFVHTAPGPSQKKQLSPGLADCYLKESKLKYVILCHSIVLCKSCNKSPKCCHKSACRTYQLKAMPFGLSTAPLEFTVVAKEVKLMAIHKGIRIHQYLDVWLLRATSHRVCLQHTQDLVQICQELGWLVNLEKSVLEPEQMFDFVGYQFDLRAGQV